LKVSPTSLEERVWEGRALVTEEQLRAILQAEIERLETLSYAELLKYLNEVEVKHSGESGGEDYYQIEIQAFWDDRKTKNLRVMAAIDDGGLKAFKPICDSLIITPEGKFL
jgi:hypothetical protein